MRRILALLLALVTALCLCVPALAASAGLELEGSGTDADPYRIGTAAELAAFRDIVNDGQTALCARLTDDIALDKTLEWMPIGKENTCAYAGTFRGDGHTVSGVNISTERESAGFFGYLSADAKVKGLTISDSIITGRRYAGAVAGYSDGSISDCHAAAAVQIKSSGAAGGIVGAMGQKADRITRCSNRAVVMVNALSGGKTGGIAGDCGTVRLTECFNAGTVTAVGSGTLLAGGLIGGCGGAFAVQLTDVYNVGRVSMTGIGSSGGLVGECSGELRVTNAYQAGTVRGAAIAGTVRGSIKLNNVYKTGAQPDKNTGSGTMTGVAVRMSGGALKKAADTLGDHFTVDSALNNNGYPLLAWQTDTSDRTGTGALAAMAEDAAGDGTVELTADDTDQTLSAAVYLTQSDTTWLLVRYIGPQLEAGKIPVYDNSPMFWSEKYEAYVCLTTDSSVDAAVAGVSEMTARAKSLTYDGDVNGSGTVDINDAQLIYAVYNTQIDTDQLTQKQLLEADVNGDGVVDTADATYLLEQLMRA